jgi:hypothetical protein
MLSVCLYILAVKFLKLKPICMKLRMYNMAPEPISAAYFINPFHQSLYMYLPIVARQRLGKIVTAETNTNATVGELFKASFSMRYVWYQRRVCGSVYPPIVARKRFGKHVPRK